jgi:hypothetical protein
MCTQCPKAIEAKDNATKDKIEKEKESIEKIAKKK